MNSPAQSSWSHRLCVREREAEIVDAARQLGWGESIVGGGVDDGVFYERDEGFLIVWARANGRPIRQVVEVRMARGRDATRLELRRRTSVYFWTLSFVMSLVYLAPLLVSWVYGSPGMGFVRVWLLFAGLVLTWNLRANARRNKLVVTATMNLLAELTTVHDAGQDPYRAGSAPGASGRPFENGRPSTRAD